MKFVKSHVWALGIAVIIGANAFAGATYHVSTKGDNKAAGTEAKPWRTIKFGVGKLVAGDTLIIREGLYREPYIKVLKSGTAKAPITIKGAEGEEAILSGNTLTKPTDWKKVKGNVYAYTKAMTTTYRNVSQNGIPLQLMVRYNDFKGKANQVKRPGQWSRNREDKGLWVSAKGGGNPGEKNVEVSWCAQLFAIPKDVHHVVVENMTFEGAYYPIHVTGDDVIIRNSVFRNCYGDGFKVGGTNPGREKAWNSERGLIDGCDIYNFGESGIDITGGDYWTVRNTKIHDSVDNRYMKTNAGNKVNGIMMKNHNVGAVVDGCEFYNMKTSFGAIAIGGNSGYDDIKCPPADGLLIKNNVIHDITAAYVVAFMGAHNSKFVNNIITNCTITKLAARSEPYCLIQIRDGRSKGGVWHKSKNNLIANNILIGNEFKKTPFAYTYSEFKDGNDSGLVIDNNIIDPKRKSYFDGKAMSLRQLQKKKKYDVNSQTKKPTFVDPKEHDYHLKPGSVGIDQGKALPKDVPLDRDGTKRPQGKGFDIGAYEQ
jgi:Right handed beta helix region